MKILVLADDLTGANDVGVEFAQRGFTTFVAIDQKIDLRKFFEQFQVIVVDTETRHLDSRQAYQTVFDWTERGASAGATFFYKKTDSTLRGNIGAELEALRAALGISWLPFVPALPQFGRTTKNGQQLVYGQALHLSSFGKDPRNPVRSSDVAEILRNNHQLTVQITDTTFFESGKQADTENQGVLVFNAESVPDLETIVRLLQQRTPFRAVAGSAALGAFLGSCLGEGRAPASGLSLPLLIVNGSLNPVSLKQVEEAGHTGLSVIQLPPTFLHGTNSEMADATHNIALEVMQILRRPGPCLLTSMTCEGLPDLSQETAAASGESVAERVGILTSHILNQLRDITLVVFGGDTLLGIARGNGWVGLRPLCEFGKGLSMARPWGKEGIILLSKSGGFGEDDLVGNLVRAVSQKSGLL